MGKGKKQKRPSGITVGYGDFRAHGDLAGMAVGQVRILLTRDAPDLDLPAEAVPHVATMDPTGPEWKAVTAPQGQALLMALRDGLPTFIVAAVKVVPENYVLRRHDVFLMFFPPAA